MYVLQMTEDLKARIVQELAARGVNKPCPRCGNNTFTVLDGFFNQPMNPTTSGVIGIASSVPAVVTACVKCGFLALHAVGVLGVLG